MSWLIGIVLVGRSRVIVRNLTIFIVRNWLSLVSSFVIVILLLHRSLSHVGAAEAIARSTDICLRFTRANLLLGHAILNRLWLFFLCRAWQFSKLLLLRFFDLLRNLVRLLLRNCFFQSFLSWRAADEQYLLRDWVGDLQNLGGSYK